jgi:uncharacterized protein (DUF433 family)
MPISYETRVAAAAAEQSDRKIRQEFARVLKVPAHMDGRKRHRLTFREVVYFRLTKSLEAEGLTLEPEDRRAVYRVMTMKNHMERGWVRVGRSLKRSGEVSATFELSEIVQVTRERIRDVRREDVLVERDPQVCAGVPVFKGTRIPVAQIVGQFRAGIPTSQIAEDYPQLSENALRYAEVRSRMGEPPGRPKRELRLQRTALEAAHR